MMLLDNTGPKAGGDGMGQATLRKNPRGLVWIGWLLAICVGGCRGYAHLYLS